MNGSRIAMLVGHLIDLSNLTGDTKVLEIPDSTPEPFTEKPNIGKIQEKRVSKNKKRNLVNKRHYR